MITALVDVVVMGLATAGLIAALWYFDIFTPSEVIAWRRLATFRGYSAGDGVFERVAEKIPLLANLTKNTNVTRLLGIANRPETVLQFWMKAVGRALAVSGVLLGADVAARVELGDWAAAPWVPVAMGAVLVLLSFVQLRKQAAEVALEAGRTLGDMLIMAASMTSGAGGLPINDVIRLLSRCAKSQALYNIIADDGWKRVITTKPFNTIDTYRQIGEVYGIRNFVKLADAMASQRVSKRSDVYTRLAQVIYAERLLEARSWAAQAKTLVTIPVAGMLVPLLTLLGVPIMVSLSQSLS